MKIKSLILALVIVLLFNNLQVFAEETNRTPLFKEMRIGDSGILDMAYGNGVYVAVGNNGFIGSSSNGVDWIQRDSNVNKTIYSVMYDNTNNQFIAVGNHRTVLISTDGVIWEQKIQNNTSYNQRLTLVTIHPNSGRYIAYNYQADSPNDTSVLYSDDNGQTWNSTPWQRFDGSYNHTQPYDVIYFKDRFIIATYGNAQGSRGLRDSLTGMSNWNHRHGGLYYRALAKDDKEAIVVAVGDNGTISTSSNGTSWTNRNSTVNAQLRQITYHNNKFYATGNNGVFLESNDGITWKRLDDLVNDANKIYSLNGDLFISGNNGLIKIEFYNGVVSVDAQSSDRSIKFTWDLIDNNDEAITKIFMNTDGVNELIEETTERTFRVEGLAPETTYNFSFVSEDYNFIDVEVTTLISEREVRQIRADTRHDRVNLSWQNPNSDIFQHVVIYRRVINQQQASLLNQFFYGKTVSASETYNPLFETNGTYFNDLSVESDTTYEYKLTTVDEEGQESEGVTIQATTGEEPPPTMGGVDGGEQEDGDYIYRWTSPTDGQVRVLVGGEEYTVVPASQREVIIPKEDMKYTKLGSPDVQLQPISSSGKEGVISNPNRSIGGVAFPLSVNDVVSGGMELIALVGGFIILALAFIFAPRLIAFIKKSLRARNEKSIRTTRRGRA